MSHESLLIPQQEHPGTSGLVFEPEVPNLSTACC